MKEYYNNTSSAYRYNYNMDYPMRNDAISPPIKHIFTNKNEQTYENTGNHSQVSVKTLAKLVLFVIFVIIPTCLAMIYFHSDTVNMKNQIESKQQEYNSLVRDNDDLENDLIKNIDLKAIRKKAKKLGMKTATAKSTKYYKVGNEEFVIQIQDFPKDE